MENRIKKIGSIVHSHDIFSKKKRSQIMAAVKGKNTLLEKEVFVFLRKKGVKFEKHCSYILGKPDIVIRKKKKVLFVDSDFWHGWRYPKWQKKLTSKFWIEKIHANRKRDSKVNRILRKEGWKILRIWEHELEKKNKESLNKIVDFLKK